MNVCFLFFFCSLTVPIRILFVVYVAWFCRVMIDSVSFWVWYFFIKSVAFCLMFVNLAFWHLYVLCLSVHSVHVNTITTTTIVCRSSPRTTIDIPGTVYRLHASPSAVRRHVSPIVLPDASSGSLDWNSLVNVASRALDGKDSSCDPLNKC